MFTAVIREAECIGCSRCIPACPVDAIIGTNKLLHTVLLDECIGCRLCVDPCPVDCIDMVPLENLYTELDKHSRALKAKQRHHARQLRLQQEAQRHLPVYASKEERQLNIKQEIQEALARTNPPAAEPACPPQVGGRSTSRCDVGEIFEIFQAQNPNPTTELSYTTTFELLIAVILSAQATDVSVNKATTELYKIANTPEQMLQLGEAKLKNYIKTIGLYNNKAANIIRACQRLVDCYDSTVPASREALESLAGVGRKTANVILNTAFGQATIAVDTHIFRVANRIGLAKGSTPLIVEQQLEKIIPNKYKHDAHHWLILHGRYVCKARKPDCTACIIRDFCEYPAKT